MARKGGRTAIVAVEVKERPDRSHEFVVGHLQRVHPPTIEAAAGAIASLASAAMTEKPCVIVDVSTAQGIALRMALRDLLPDGIHKAHAYRGADAARAELFASFLRAYSTERVKLLPDLRGRKELINALVFYTGGAKVKDQVELPSEDEALVVALGLGMAWPRHGGKAEAAG